MSEFFEHSKSIVEDFLQTAVFLDDRATFSYEERVVEVIEETPFRGVKVAIKEPEETKAEEEAVEQDGEGIEHLLDAKTIIDTFMNKGIVCSVLKCEEETYDIQVENYLKLIQKADMIVLDWDLFKDNGDRVVSLLQSLILADTELHPFRSIVIYTANNLDNVKKKLLEIDIKFPRNSYVSSTHCKYTSISIYSKPNSKEAVEERTVEFSELVNKCIEDFTDSFHGIVPNVTMASLSEIRKNTHNLLGVLNKNLDIAYLSHRALLSNPSEAEKHIEELIVSEIESIIHENNTGKNAEIQFISKYENIQNKKYQDIDFTQCIEKGVDNILKGQDEKVNELSEDIKTCFTQKWFLNGRKSKNSEKDFAILGTLQTEYTDKLKYLTLGVIIEQQNTRKDKYLCLQPRCDSLRLNENTEFIFLKLKRSGDYKFDILLQNDNSKFTIKYGLSFRKVIEFTPTDGCVTHDKDLLFIDSSGNTYKFISILKKLQAQRIVNEYAANISRVGLNESEYLRRNTPRTFAGRI